MLEVTMYSNYTAPMGGTSQDVKRLKKNGFYPLYFGFSWPFIFFAFPEIIMCFKQLEESNIMSCDTKAQLSDFKLGQKLFQFLRYEF